MTDDQKTVKPAKRPTKMQSGGKLYRDARTKEETARIEEAQKKTEELAARIGIDLGADIDADTDDLPHGADRPESETPPPQMPEWGTIKLPPPPEPPPVPERDWRETRSTALELVGMAALTIGVGMRSRWAGVVVLGINLLTLGVAEGIK